jgi:hypothetical protein
MKDMEKVSDKPKKPLCGKIVKTMDNTRMPCLRPAGHLSGCNPFSDTPPMVDILKK